MVRKKNSASLLIYIIAFYFIILAFANFLQLVITNLSSYVNGLGFLYISLPGIMTDPFSFGIIQTIRLYDIFSINIKEIFIIIIYLFAGYSLIKTKKLGLYLGLFISFFGLIFGTTLGLRSSPVWYIQNMLGLLNPFNLYYNLGSYITVICYIFNLFTAILLIKKFMNKKEG